MPLLAGPLCLNSGWPFGGYGSETMAGKFGPARTWLARRYQCPNVVDELEVLTSIASLHGHTLDDIVRVASEKRSERGGFDERLWLERP